MCLVADRNLAWGELDFYFVGNVLFCSVVFWKICSSETFQTKIESSILTYLCVGLVTVGWVILERIRFLMHLNILGVMFSFCSWSVGRSLSFERVWSCVCHEYCGECSTVFFCWSKRIEMMSRKLLPDIILQQCLWLLFCFMLRLCILLRGAIIRLFILIFRQKYW